MGKRVGLFLITNIAIVITLSIVWSLISAVTGRTVGQGQLATLAIFCLFWGMGGAFISLAISRWVAKRAMGVQLVNGRTGDRTLDELHRTVERLARQAGLPEMPEVGVYDSPEVNAFATGPTKSKALVAVSTGLLRTMRQDEVEGVLGHEIAHVANGDMVTMTLIQGVVNAFVMFAARIIAGIVRQSVDERLAWVVGFAVTIVLEILFGIIGMMVVAWFSRRREFRADAGGAELAGRDKMVAALERLAGTKSLVDPNQGSLATLKIAGGGKGLLMVLLSTHPPIEQRIATLRAGRMA